MKTASSVLALLLFLSLGIFAGCNNGSGGGGESAEEDDPNAELIAQLVGTWRAEAQPSMTMSYSANGRVQTDIGDQISCPGAFEISNGRLSVEYDEGVTDCRGGPWPIEFEGDDLMLGTSGRWTRESADDPGL